MLEGTIQNGGPEMVNWGKKQQYAENYYASILRVTNYYFLTKTSKNELSDFFRGKKILFLWAFLLPDWNHPQYKLNVLLVLFVKFCIFIVYFIYFLWIIP